MEVGGVVGMSGQLDNQAELPGIITYKKKSYSMLKYSCLERYMH